LVGGSKKLYKLCILLDFMEYNIIVEKGEDGYFISEVVELPGCHTQGKTMKELLENTKEAISLYIEE